MGRGAGYGVWQEVADPQLVPRLGLATLDKDGSIAHCDAVFAQLLARTSDELIGESLNDIVAELRSDAFLSGAQTSVVVNGRGLAFKCMRASDGQHSAVVVQDLSHQQEQEKQLRASVEAFEQLVDASPVGIIVLDREQRVTLWNSAAEQIFGWTTSEILGKPYPLVGEDQKQEFGQLFDQVFSGAGFREMESIRLHKDGSPIALNMSTAPIRNSEGQVVAALAILSDITQQRLLEEQLERSARLEAVGQLASGVAHNFNNILTVIIANCGFITRRGNATPHDLSSVEAIAHCAREAEVLTSELLTFGRKQIIRPTRIDLNRAASGTTEMLTRVFGPGIEFVLDLDSDLPEAHLDSTQFEQLLVNLATNARDAMQGQGRITISTAVHDPEAGPAPEIVVRVADTGHGIPPDVLPKIFEPFFTTKDAGEGTGLGLATSYGMAKQAGGRLEVKSDVGVGTCFSLFLPIRTGQQLTPSNGVGLSSTELLESSSANPGRRILMVEDDDLVREALQGLLEMSDYETTAASSGIEALEILEGAQFDALLTDVYMPHMAGAELAAKVSTLYPRLPILFMSGNLADPELRDMIENGQASIIQKPISDSDLVRALREVVSGRTFKWNE